MQWAWGLDGNHDAAAPAHTPDQAMQQATVNLLADMGAQPRLAADWRRSARPLIAAAKSRTRFAPASIVTSPAAGGTVGSGDRVTITGTATDDGGGVVAGVEVSVDGGTTWRRRRARRRGPTTGRPGAPGAATIRTRAIDDSGNRETAGAGIAVSVVPGNCPCTSLWSASTVPADRSMSDDASPVELGVKFRSDVDGFINGVRFYKARRQHRHAHRQPVDDHRHAAGARAMFTAESAVRLAGGAVRRAGRDHREHDLRRVVSHQRRPLRGVRRLLHARCGIDRSPLHAPATGRVGGNGVYGYGASAFPTADVQRDQLLGRRRVRQHAGHDRADDCRRDRDARSTARPRSSLDDGRERRHRASTTRPIELVPGGGDAQRLGCGVRHRAQRAADAG